MELADLTRAMRNNDFLDFFRAFFFWQNQARLSFIRAARKKQFLWSLKKMFFFAKPGLSEFH